MTEIDNLIQRVEHLYQHVTGHPPVAPLAQTPFPADHDAVAFVESQIDRLIQTLSPPSASSPWTPAARAFESDDEFVVLLDIPGVSPETLEVSLDRGLLWIHGHRAPHAMPPAARTLAAEVPVGPLRRALALPPSFVHSEISARLRDGVLELRCQRGAPSKVTAKTIPVQ